MSDLDQLFSEYKAAHRAGNADPKPFLVRAAGGDRAKLAALIETYLTRSPRHEFDAGAFRDSPAAAATESAQRSLAGSSGLWPTLLPRLRNQARLRRADVVAQLAARLGAQAQQQKVAAYYHQMEQGLLPAAGVSDKVLEALSAIVGYSMEGLRKAGQMPAPGPPGALPGSVFARTKSLGAPEGPASTSQSTGPDEVDRLFRDD
jgi:hypothetical protein